MSDEIETARAALSAIPGVGGAGEIARLGGLTNLVYRVESDEGSLCLRLPGKGTEEYIDRKVEKVNATAAASPLGDGDEPSPQWTAATRAPTSGAPAASIRATAQPPRPAPVMRAP